MTNKPLRGNESSINCSPVWPHTGDTRSSNTTQYKVVIIELTVAMNYDF